jgi:hypothetical protein
MGSSYFATASPFSLVGDASAATNATAAAGILIVLHDLNFNGY